MTPDSRPSCNIINAAIRDFAQKHDLPKLAELANERIALEKAAKSGDLAAQLQMISANSELNFTAIITMARTIIEDNGPGSLAEAIEYFKNQIGRPPNKSEQDYLITGNPFFIPET